MMADASKVGDARAPPPTGPAGSSATVVVSLRSRGIPSYNLSSWCLGGRQLLELAKTVFDIYSSAINTFKVRSWNAIMGVVIQVGLGFRV